MSAKCQLNVSRAFEGLLCKKGSVLLELFVLSFTLARFALFCGLTLFAFLGRQVWRRFDTLLAQTLVLYLLLMLNHPLFLFADQSLDLLFGERFVREQVLVDKERGPSVCSGIARLFRREVAVLPVGQLLRLGNLPSEEVLIGIVRVGLSLERINYQITLFIEIKF